MGLVLTDLALLIPAFSLLLAPPVLAVWLLCLTERSPTIPLSLSRRDGIHGFGTMLKPRYVVGAKILDQ